MAKSKSDKIIVKFIDKDVKLSEYLKEMKDIKEIPEISVVVPAYNEDERIYENLQYTIEILQKNNFSFEIIVVSDGSKDKTIEVALKSSYFKEKKIDLKVIDYQINKGKGGAVRIGALSSRGKYVLMADADGATEFTDFLKIYKIMKNTEKNGLGLVAGSRHHLVQAVVKKRTVIRNLLMYISNFVIQTICGVKINDTQCGFKLFTKNTAKILFLGLHLERWAFDVELFIIAKYNGIPFVEEPVNWREMPGSKLNVIEASFTMFRDFLMLRLFYLFKVWKPEAYYTLPN